ncbi:unnamed protein product [Zymoseptoria tritici ST99CH_3D1]|nr:unnamed protein product [Zymoseptoria tritici ST99CH_3D1]
MEVESAQEEKPERAADFLPLHRISTDEVQYRDHIHQHRDCLHKQEVHNADPKDYYHLCSDYQHYSTHINNVSLNLCHQYGEEDIDDDIEQEHNHKWAIDYLEDHYDKSLIHKDHYVKPVIHLLLLHYHH